MKDLMYIDHPILAIYPNVHGFGYAIFPEQNVLKEAGMATIRLREETKYIERILHMIDVYHPSVILLPTRDGKFNRKRERIKALLDKIRYIAKANNIIVKSFSREQIREAFEGFHAYSKIQIAEKICVWFPELTERCPSKRGAYMAEDFSQGIFDAVSLVMTYNAQEIKNDNTFKQDRLF